MVFVDKVLPFGLRSAPLIFSAIADALQFMMGQNGVKFADHYIDDFITLGKPNSTECADNVQLMLSTCEKAGVPIEANKSEGTASCITFLGIEIDTVTMELRLPKEKLSQLHQVMSGSNKSLRALNMST